MELLDQAAYTGPPPRYTKDQTVYHAGQPYTVSAVCGRAPLVGWVYELDGPGELIKVGEGEISARPGMGRVDDLQVTIDPGNYVSGITGGSVLAMVKQLAGVQLGIDPGYAVMAAWDAGILDQCAEISKQPAAVVRAALDRYVLTPDALMLRLLSGMVLTSDGTLARPISLDKPADTAARYNAFLLREAATTPDRAPLNRAARRAKHRPWTPPAR